MKFDVKNFRKLILALSIIMLALVFSPTSLSYWVDIQDGIIQSQNSLEIGSWKKKLVVNNNLSNDFFTRTILIDWGDEFGQSNYNDLPQNPAPKQHSGVLQSDYVFEGWFFEDGEQLTPTTILYDDAVVYPSWKSLSTWKYTLSGSAYNIAKFGTAMFSGDVYIPGWRYQGRKINSFTSTMSTQSAPLIVDGLWIGQGITSVVASAFRYAQMSSLVLEDGLETIGRWAFANTTNQSATLAIPDSLTTITQETFREMSYSGTLEIGQNSNLETIGDHAFYRVGISSSLYLPSELKTIGQYAFQNNSITGSLTLPSELQTIGQYAFQNNNFTGSLTLSSKLQSIGEYAFNNNNFSNSTDEVSLSLPSTLTTLSRSAFQNAFRTVNADDTVNYNGTLILENATQLTAYNQYVFAGNNFTGGLKIAGVASTVGYSAFENNKFTGELDLSQAKALATIGQTAFKNAGGFTSLKFAMDGVLNSIANNAFQNNKIQEIIFPPSLTSSLAQVFAGNPVKTMYVPLSLTTMGAPSNVNNVTIYFEALDYPTGWNSSWKAATQNNTLYYGCFVENEYPTLKPEDEWLN